MNKHYDIAELLSEIDAQSLFPELYFEKDEKEKDLRNLPSANLKTS